MSRTRDTDACPGARQTHPAADGALARIRLPGGMISAAQLAALAHTAAEFGSPALELTSRGNVQVRAITDPAGVAAAVAAAGLLPSASHERVRNIVASPLSGRVGGTADVRDHVTRLDRAIRAEPRLADLPGRFWFGLDDGRGDVAGLRPDLTALWADTDTAALLLAGRDTGVRVPAADAVATLIALAARFATIRGDAWRVAELTDPETLLAGLEPVAEAGATWTPPAGPPVGWLEQAGGRVTLGAAVPLGVLSARVAEYLAAIDAPLVVTPWRSVLICDLDEAAADTVVRVLAPLGLIFDAHSPWLSISACVGSPGCARSAADVRADAAARLDEPATGHRHFVGCERACGSPPGAQVLVATADGYRELTP